MLSKLYKLYNDVRGHGMMLNVPIKQIITLKKCVQYFKVNDTVKQNQMIWGKLYTTN